MLIEVLGIGNGSAFWVACSQCVGLNRRARTMAVLSYTMYYDAGRLLSQYGYTRYLWPLSM